MYGYQTYGLFKSSYSLEFRRLGTKICYSKILNSLLEKFNTCITVLSPFINYEFNNCQITNLFDHINSSYSCNTIFNN